MKKRLVIFGLLGFGFMLGGCINKHGISLKYYSDCKEYYDLQGYYHKECGEDDIITYKELFIKKEKPKVIEGQPSPF